MDLELDWRPPPETYELIEGSPGWRLAHRVKYIVGVDLGQSADPTAIAVVEHTVTHKEHQNGKRSPVGERFDVRFLQRLPLGLSYPAVVEHVGHVLRRPPLDAGADLVIDETGVGRAVGDIFVSAGLKPNRVTITAGNEATRAGVMRWHVAKSVLISTLDARLHTGDLRFAADLSDADAMAEELKDFRRKVGVAGRYSYEARVGKHDDLVLAVAIAVWFSTRSRPPIAQSGQQRWIR